MPRVHPANPTGFFTNIGRKLDRAIGWLMWWNRVKPTPAPLLLPKPPQYPEVEIQAGDETVTAFLIEKRMSPAVANPVNISNNDQMAKAMAAAKTSWNPEFHLVGDEVDVELPTEVQPLTLQDALSETKKDN